MCLVCNTPKDLFKKHVSAFFLEIISLTLFIIQYKKSAFTNWKSRNNNRRTSLNCYDTRIFPNLCSVNIGYGGYQNTPESIHFPSLLTQNHPHVCHYIQDGLPKTVWSNTVSGAAKIVALPVAKVVLMMMYGNKKNECRVIFIGTIHIHRFIHE
jgi:hypothetical protein